MCDKNFALNVLGTVELRDPTGADVTPRLKKSRALLAYLALSGERRIERDALQKLLWADRMAPQARDCLKQSLSELRRAFRAAPVCPLVSDGGPVALMLDDIRVDAVHDPPSVAAPPLLEGMGGSDAPFDRWLAGARLRRAAPAHVIAPASALPADPRTPDAPPRARRFCIEIQPVHGAGGTAVPMANLMLDGFARSLDQTGLFRVIDRRTAPNASPASDGSGPVPDMWLGVTALDAGTQAVLSVALKRADSAAVMWSTSQTVDLPLRDAGGLYRMAAHSAEQIADCIWQQTDRFSDAHTAATAAMKAIRHISRLSPGDITAADQALCAATEALDTSPLHAWCAYLTAYKLEKSNGNAGPELRDLAAYHSARALELDSRNPLTRALVAHVHSFVLRDPQRAAEIVSPVRDMVGQNAMLADTVGLVHFYAGRYDEAVAHAKLACTLGRWSPLRYAFTTLLSASQMMRGDMDGAIHSGRRALAQHPAGLEFQYEPTLRTLAAACGQKGHTDEGRRALAALDRQTGKTTALSMKEVPANVFPNPEVFQMVRNGIGKLHA